MLHAAGVGMLVRVLVREVHIELNAFYCGFLGAARVEVEAVEAKFFQLVLEFVKIDTEIEQRADQHITADAAEDIEIKGFHCFWARALIWLAA
jgi:hypothetical protein